MKQMSTTRYTVTIMPMTGFLIRMLRYLSAMYPAGQRILSALLLYVSLAAMFLITQGMSPSLTVFQIGAGTSIVFLLLLLLRLMDEIKDKDIDARLFPQRPLPSGLVTELDIRIAIATSVASIIAVLATAGWVLWVGIIVLVYAGLMYRFFFVPGLLKRSLLLTLATHNPIVPLMLILLLCIAVEDAGIALADLQFHPIVLLLIQYWGMSFSWEVARKIRAPWQETAYVTYSSIFGTRGAIAVAATGQILAIGAGAWMLLRYQLGPGYVVMLGVGSICLAGSYLRALQTSSPAPISLRASAEYFMISIMLAGILEFALRGIQG